MQLDLAWLSLGGLLIVILVSCTTSVNAGLLAIAIAWLLGVYAAPWYGVSFGVSKIIAGFPADLFLTLLGTTLLFGLAQANGTLDQLARVAVRCCRGNAAVLPIALFLLPCGLASIGAGNIAAAALLAPMAMAIARRAGMPPLLVAIVVSHGAIAGATSPFAPTGIIANTLLREKLGVIGQAAQIYLCNLLANAAVAAAAYALLGGWQLARAARRSNHAATTITDQPSPTANDAAKLGESPQFTIRHWLTITVTTTLIVGVVLGGVHIGLGAFAAAVLLIVFRLGDERQALAELPWSVLVMVCGVSVLTALLEGTGGLDRFAELIAQVSSPRSVTAVVAFVTGIVSVYSSTSGVVLPAFLPMSVRLAERLEGGDPMAIALSMIVGGHLVDSSPLSTIGALCLAATPLTSDRRVLFNRMLAWGLSMSLVGAVLCFVVFGLD